jgi:hypothetical protein
MLLKPNNKSIWAAEKRQRALLQKNNRIPIENIPLPGRQPTEIMDVFSPSIDSLFISEEPASKKTKLAVTQRETEHMDREIGKAIKNASSSASGEKKTKSKEDEAIDEWLSDLNNKAKLGMVGLMPEAWRKTSEWPVKLNGDMRGILRNFYSFLQAKGVQ